MKNTRANIFGGTIAGDWRLDFTGNKPGTKALGPPPGSRRIGLRRFKGPLGSGAVDLTVSSTMSGLDGDSLVPFDQRRSPFHLDRRRPENFARSALSPARALWRRKITLDTKKARTSFRTVIGRVPPVLSIRGSIFARLRLDLKFIEEAGGIRSVSGTLQTGAGAPPLRPSSAPAWRR